MRAKTNMGLYYKDRKFGPDELFEFRQAEGTLTQPFANVRADDLKEAEQYLALVKSKASSRGQASRSAPAPRAVEAPRPAPAPVAAPAPVRVAAPAPAPAPVRAPAPQYYDVASDDDAGERSYFVEGYEDDIDEEVRPRYSRSSSRRSSQPSGASARPIYHPDAPVQYWQGRQIGCSIGGMATYCQPREKESHAEALTRGGLTQNRALEVVQILKDEGIMTTYFGRDPNSPEARRAQQILAEVGGFVCRR